MACTLDFRRLDEGLGGQKNKRKRSDPEPDSESIRGSNNNAVEESMDVDPPSKRQAIPSTSDPSKPAYDRPTYDGTIAGKVSGRPWKQVRTQRASATRVTRRPPSLDLRNKEKEMKRAYKERMNELKEEIRLNKVEKRRKREEREKKKKENILKSGTKLQKITNPKTLKKIAKSKDRKLLKVVPDEFVNGGKKEKKKQ